MPKTQNCNIIIQSKQSINENIQPPAITYSPFVFSVCGFPYRNPNFTEKTSTLTYKYNNGDQHVLFLSSRNGLPFGILPRRIINYICWQIKETGSQLISLGQTKTDIIKKIFTTNKPGGKDFKLFQEMFQRTIETNFFHAYDKLSKDGIHYNAIETLSVPVGSYRTDIDFWDSISGDGVLKISDQFMSLVNHSFAVNDDKLRLLNSPRQIDIYCFLHRQNHDLVARNKYPELFFDYRTLKAIFGRDLPDTPQGMAKFKYTFKDSIKEIVQVTNDVFNLDCDQHRLILKPVRSLIFDLSDPRTYLPPQPQQSNEEKTKEDKFIVQKSEIIEILGVSVNQLTDSTIRKLSETLRNSGVDCVIAAYQYAKDRSNQRDKFESYLGRTLDNPDWYAGLLESNRKQKLIEENKQKTAKITSAWRLVTEEERTKIKQEVKLSLQKLLKLNEFPNSKYVTLANVNGLLSTYNLDLNGTTLNSKMFNYLAARSELCYYYWLLNAYPDEDHKPPAPTHDIRLGWELAQYLQSVPNQVGA